MNEAEKSPNYPLYTSLLKPKYSQNIATARQSHLSGSAASNLGLENL
jgi:hypothetical protein